MDFDETRLYTVRSRRSIFLIALTSFALSFSALGMAPASATESPKENTHSVTDFTLEEATIDSVIVQYESGVSAIGRDGMPTGQYAIEDNDLSIDEFIGTQTYALDISKPLTESEAKELATDLESLPQIKFAEPNISIELYETKSQTISDLGLWGLDRIDQRSLPTNNSYIYDATGSGVNAYIIDSGIYLHSDFTGRLKSGFTSIEDGLGTSDCSGHGTHVAGILGGATYGVAKEVSLIPVRVFPCSGSTTLADVIKGINWILKEHKVGDLAVANFSLGGERNALLDFYIEKLLERGILVVAASGNDSKNSCDFSPAGTPNVITVNSSGKTDTRSTFSNFGACSDIFAPGEDILSAGIGSPISKAISKGTSMASPFVAGAVAKILEKNPTFNRSQVVSELLDNSTPFVSNELRDPSRLLYSAALVTQQKELADPVLQQQLFTISSTAAQTQASLEAAEAARLAEIARLAELKRLAEIERLANEKAAAEAARVAAEQAAAAEAARVAASVPVVSKTLKVRALKKKRLSVSIAAPAGSTTVIQRKVGKKWKTVTVRQKVGKKWKKIRVAETLPSSTIRVPRAGTYRVQITIPSGTITTKSYRVR